MPFAWVIIVLLWMIVSAIGRSKKNQAAQNKKKEEQEQSRQKTAQQYARRQAQGAASASPASQPAASGMSRQDDWEDEEENWDRRDAQRTSPAPAAQSARPASAQRHETRPLEAHMHTPVMGTEGDGTEGIDCCHEYMLDMRTEDKPADILPMQGETEELRAKALLQGVIFSEILGRRHVRRYGKRSA